MVNIIILLIGDPTYNSPYIFFLEEIGVQVEELLYAHEGIESILEKKHPLIIVNDIVYTENLDIPNEIPLDAYPKISQYIIKQIRNSELNKDTPIIAKIFPSGNYVVPQEYISAGANDLSIYGEEFKELVQKYLK